MTKYRSVKGFKTDDKLHIKTTLAYNIHDYDKCNNDAFLSIKKAGHTTFCYNFTPMVTLKSFAVIKIRMSDYNTCFQGRKCSGNHDEFDKVPIDTNHVNIVT